MLGKQQIPNKLRKKVDKELEAGEFIRWVEQPIPSLLTLESASVFLFGIPWTIFAVHWTWGAGIPDLSKGGRPELFGLMFGLPFILVGLWMLFSPIWEWLKAFRTVYLITDKRAISIEDGWITTIRSFTPEQLKDVYRKERRGGTGDVIITTQIWKDREGDLKSKEIGFVRVRNPKEIERLLKQLAQTRD